MKYIEILQTVTFTVVDNVDVLFLVVHGRSDRTIPERHRWPIYTADTQHSAPEVDLVVIVYHFFVPVCPRKLRLI